MKRVAALLTTKHRTGRAIALGDMTTLGACARGVTRINPDHRRSHFLCLVLDKTAQLRERPTVNAPRLLTLARLDAAANVGEVFDHYRRTERRRGDDLLTENVVTVTTETGLHAAHLAQVPFRALGAFLLQGTTQIEEPRFPVSPSLFAEKLAVARHGGLRKAQVHTDYRVGRRDFGGGHINDDVQPPATIAVEKVSGAGFCASVLLAVRGQGERHALPSARGRERHIAMFPRDFEGVGIVARRATRAVWRRNHPALLRQRERAFDRFRCLHARLNVVIAHQIGIGSFLRVVQRMMQRDAVLFPALIAVRSNRVKHGGELACRL